jgi:hypothetical protein
VKVWVALPGDVQIHLDERIGSDLIAEGVVFQGVTAGAEAFRLSGRELADETVGAVPVRIAGIAR